MIAEHFHLQNDLNALTGQMGYGNVPFMEAFIKRICILGKYPVEEINALLGEAAFYQQVAAFVIRNRKNSLIVTENLKCWTEKISGKLGCDFYASDCIVENHAVKKLTAILRKERVVEEFQNKGYTVVFIGDGSSDLEGMRLADISIAAGLAHNPAASILSIADYAVYTEEALCRILNQLC